MTIAICLAFMCVDEFSFVLSIHSVVLNVFIVLTEILFNIFSSFSLSFAVVDAAIFSLSDDDQEVASG